MGETHINQQGALAPIYPSIDMETDMSKARKNDIIVVKETKSLTTAKHKTKTYDVYYIARVCKATRLGIVQQFQKIGGNTVMVENNNNFRVLTIEDADKQELARQLANLLKAQPEKNNYANQLLIRDAILTTIP